jgi:hypothetical protein
MKEASSFRDPDGFVYYDHGHLYRAVTDQYRKTYDHFIGSGLYSKLVDKGYLISHKEILPGADHPDNIYRILEPELVEFISYPYEWSFSQLKDAAYLTLDIQKTALEHGMTLKDASAFNIQFHKGRPVLIDTLSFELYTENRPWSAYRQFCQHFLAPIALMGHKDIRLNGLSRNYIDGIPLDLAVRLLPLRTRLKPGLFLHLVLHASAQKKYDSNKVKVSELKGRFTMDSFKVLIGTLRKTLDHISWITKGTEWGDYYEPGVHAREYTESKKQLVSEYINRIKPGSVWDLGSNTGTFSRLACESGSSVISFDIDPLCVETNYREVKSGREERLLPLLLDLTNPTPALGWANAERKSIFERAGCDMILALAIIHHLSIANNLPFSMIASQFSQITKWLAIEFIPKDDSKVQVLLKNRVDIFTDYDQGSFEKAFDQFFHIRAMQEVGTSRRLLYLMESKNDRKG